MSAYFVGFFFKKFFIAYFVYLLENYIFKGLLIEFCIYKGGIVEYCRFKEEILKKKGKALRNKNLIPKNPGHITGFH